MVKKTKKSKRQLLALFIISGLTLPLSSYTYAKADVAQTQKKLKQLNAEITQLRRSLSSKQVKRKALHSRLSVLEKQMGQTIAQLRNIEKSMHEKETKISMLEKKVNQLNEDLKQQQNMLAQHIRTRYQMGQYQPLKWIINQDAPTRISRLVTYYNYLISSRIDLIDSIDKTKKQLDDNQKALEQELAENKQLGFKLSLHQKQLAKDKQQQTQLINTINEEISSNKHQLAEHEKNKEKLSQILQQLAQQSRVAVAKPFPVMRKKLPSPLAVRPKSVQNMNQGLTYFADEGTIVTAIYPGKVVFSDWLKGYGLLLIIDHGQGFMSLYAHNQSLFKVKGESVLQNEQIASVGHTGGIKQNGLYFEIRQNGKAVPPLRWLA